jgi:hypothetical protein
MSTYDLGNGGHPATPGTPYGTGDPFPKPILQTRRVEPVGDSDGDDGMGYSQARAVAIVGALSAAIWILGLLYIFVAVMTHGNA